MLDRPLSKVLKTTKQKLELLNKLGLFTVQDLLTYYPRTYEDRSYLTPVSQFSIKAVNNSRGVLSAIRNETTKFGKHIQKAVFRDEAGGQVECVWFGQAYLATVWAVPKKALISGKARYDMKKMTLQSPTFEEDTGQALHAGGIVAVYHETEGITSSWLREKIESVVEFAVEFSDILPTDVLQEMRFPSKAAAIRTIHFPESDEAIDTAQTLLAFEELYVLQLGALIRKYSWSRYGKGPVIPMDVELMKQYQVTLPFQLTGAQKVSLFEILRDMSSGRPMLRMLQGDVGSGKTVVAAMAVLNAVKAGYMCALMAPTEILAKQHLVTLTRLLPGVRVTLLVGSMKESEKKVVRNFMKSGALDLVVGTHALIQDGVEFHRLGLAVIDEQHRFGVEQRKALADRTDIIPHLLMMSATPIPRSLALTVYGDQDLSVIDEMPSGRRPIITKVVHPGARRQANLFIDDQIGKGRQVFVVCPLIEESEKLEEVKNVMSEVQRLRDDVFVNRRVTFLHGKMKAEEKDKIMAEFKAGSFDILVATSVVEVGIDIPNATVMLIEGSERFGLSQLHQFRGRVGRGADQSYCFLFTTDVDQRTSRRLKAMQEHVDGFKLAEIDLEIRGPGELYGLRQSGIPDLKMASILDGRTISLARRKAQELLDTDRDLLLHPELKKLVEKGHALIRA